MAGNHQIYGHIWCSYTVLANPMYGPCRRLCILNHSLNLCKSVHCKCVCMHIARHVLRLIMNLCSSQTLPPERPANKVLQALKLCTCTFTYFTYHSACLHMCRCAAANLCHQTAGQRGPASSGQCRQRHQSLSGRRNCIHRSENGETQMSDVCVCPLCSWFLAGSY